MNIISSKEKINRMIDGIHTILSLPEDQYNLLIQKLIPNNKTESLNFYYTTDECENPDGPIQLGLEQRYNKMGKNISRYYYSGKYFTVNEILEKCQSMLEEYPTDSLESSRISEMMQTRDLSSLKKYYSNKNTVNPQLLDKIFEILSSDDMLSKFFDYDNNTETFAIDGQEISISEYLKNLEQIFGSIDKDENSNFISRDFFIPELEEFKNRYSQIFDKINVDKYDPHYTFDKISGLDSTAIRDGDEPDWEISPKIRESIFLEMPQNLSLEEQAMYIYGKMCSIFSYDEGYLYKDKLNKINYSSTFSKEHLESLNPGDKITCYDFARMYSKILNELDGNIKAVTILEGPNKGHALTGFYTENVSATVDAINVVSNTEFSNDLMKAKNGIKLKGIKIISDRKGLIEQALDKVYPQILGKQPQSIEGYLQELMNLPQEQDVPNDIDLKLQSLLETMKASHVFGNEFVQTLNAIRNTKYFGDDKLPQVYLGELQSTDDGCKKYKRHVLLTQPKNIKNENPLNTFYLIDTDTLDLIISSGEDIGAKLNSGELIYESEMHKLPETDKEV